MKPFTVELCSASYDQPITYRLIPSGPVLRAIHLLQQAQMCDGYCDFLVDDASNPITSEDEFLEVILNDLDSGAPGDRERLEKVIGK